MIPQSVVVVSVEYDESRVKELHPHLLQPLPTLPPPPKKFWGSSVHTLSLLLKNASNAPRNLILEICDGCPSLHVKQAHSPLVCY